MLGFEPRISGVESDRSANCATTIAQESQLFWETMAQFKTWIPAIILADESASLRGRLLKDLICLFSDTFQDLSDIYF